jgi:hypothetical protein
MLWTNVTQKKRADLLETLEKILQESPHLVKIFVSSRDDQDIVCHLEDYPNLKIESHRNKNNIISFVTAETQRLVKSRQLLRFSSDKDELKKAIIDQVTKGAGGMYVIVPGHNFYIFNANELGFAGLVCNCSICAS